MPALHAHQGRVLIAVDDLTAVTPTLVAFWLAVLRRRPAARLRQRAAPERRQAVVEAGRDRDSAAGARSTRGSIAQTYLRQTGTLVESPPLFVAHLVQQANGNPQALADLLADASKERVVDKQRIRELRHAAGVRYLDFTPVHDRGAGLGGRRALPGHRHRRHRAVHLRRDAGGGGHLASGCSCSGGRGRRIERRRGKTSRLDDRDADAQEPS
ncbi:MAG: hypothetical protein MZV65_15455 [Chromatiales bacterium]|nr:hypothetical protein [Chromatiales bacterium]